MIHPDLLAPGATDALAAAWAERGSLRIAPLLAPEAAEAVEAALMQQPMSLLSPAPGGFRYQYWALSYHPDETTDPTLAALGRWIHGGLAALCSKLTGRRLGPPADGRLLSTLYTRGCYLDPHNDADGRRSVAYVIGLSRPSWPASEGGHLEFLSVSGGAVVVSERRLAGWNSLDLFDVSARAPLHRVPPLLTDRQRRVFAGWLYEAESLP